MNQEHISEEGDAMSDEQFLTKLKLIINGKITHAGMHLLGNLDYDYMFQSAASIMWRLYGADNMDMAKYICTQETSILFVRCWFRFYWNFSCPYLI